jgi:hypothetical protein
MHTNIGGIEAFLAKKLKELGQTPQQTKHRWRRRKPSGGCVVA